jgi:hypothetical protein
MKNYEEKKMEAVLNSNFVEEISIYEDEEEKMIDIINSRTVEEISICNAADCNFKCLNSNNNKNKKNADCSICTENPKNSIEDLQRAGRSYTPK